jgi:DNA-binding HxlR family transcriptional regulator
MPAKQYGVSSALARSLELVGDRWTLLLIRELLVAPRRYSDLQKALRAIPTNLLADRLRRLEEDGIVERYEAPPPVATTLYQLTARGQQLEESVLALMRWGAPLLADSARADEPMPSDWPVLWLRDVLDPGVSTGTVIAFDVGAATRVTVEIGDGRARLAPPGAKPDVVVAAPSHPAVLEVLSGAIPIDEAVASGRFSIAGDPGRARMFAKQLRIKTTG